MTGSRAADVYVRCLEAEGVRRVFGIPGEETLDLDHAHSSIEFVPVRHEQGGAFADRPLVLAGNGILRARAAPALREFARATGIPVAETFMGKGALAQKAIVVVDSVAAEIDAYFTPAAELLGDLYHVLLLLRLAEECRHAREPRPQPAPSRLRDVVDGRLAAGRVVDGLRRRRRADERPGAQDRDAPGHGVRHGRLGGPRVRVERLEAAPALRRRALRHGLHEPRLRRPGRVVRHTAWRCDSADDFGRRLRHALRLDVPKLIVLPIDYSVDVAISDELGEETVIRT